MISCMINGEISQFTDTRSRGLNYGDGLFETLSVKAGRPQAWQAHMDRLGAGCERLGIPMPPQAVLLRDVQTVSARLPATVVKIVLVRGGGGRGYRPTAIDGCTRIISAHPWPENIPAQASEGVRAQICQLRLAIQPSLGGIKHLNRLEQVLASTEPLAEGITEGIMFDMEGHLISAISANIFLVMDRRLLTPRLDRCGIRGVARSLILSAFETRCEQRRIQGDMLSEADEVFICNSIRGVIPVISIGEQVYNIGPVTREIQSWLTQRFAV